MKFTVTDFLYQLPHGVILTDRFGLRWRWSEDETLRLLDEPTGQPTRYLTILEAVTVQWYSIAYPAPGVLQLDEELDQMHLDIGMRVFDEIPGTGPLSAEVAGCEA